MLREAGGLWARSGERREEPRLLGVGAVSGQQRALREPSSGHQFSASVYFVHVLENHCSFLPLYLLPCSSLGRTVSSARMNRCVCSPFLFVTMKLIHLLLFNLYA